MVAAFDRDDQDDGFGHVPQAAAGLETVDARHDDVDQDGVGVPLIGQAQPGLGVGGILNLEALVLQAHAEDLAEARVVVD